MSDNKKISEPYLSKDKAKELKDKRKYYREHPDEAKKNVGKKFDGH